MAAPKLTHLAAIAVAAVVAVTTGSAEAASPDSAYVLRHRSFMPLDIPADALADPRGTAHIGMNNLAEITGAYAEQSGAYYGFVRSRSGAYSKFNVPGASVTLPSDINDHGDVVGFSLGATPSDVHGFVRDRRGVVTPVDFPGATSTVALGIDNHGRIVGGYGDTRGFDHGFVLSRGVYRTIDAPGATRIEEKSNAAATDINDHGDIVGFYVDDDNTYHGYLRRKGRRFSAVDPPRAADVPDLATTVPFGINNDREIVGQYADKNGVLHGYLRTWRGRYRTIDRPDGSATVAADIDDRGRILVPAPTSYFKGRIPGAPG